MPADGESQQEFIDRCMGEIADEFDDEGQRMAVCMTQWQSSRGERTMEFRHTTEVRAIEDDDGPRIQGYAAVFNTLSQQVDWGFREKIAPGAFAKTIKDGDVRALFNHDPNYVLGRTKSGTLKLREDEHGLFFDVTPPDEPWVRSLVASIKRGDINQASFAFMPIQEDWAKNEKQPVRILREVRLFDVSPVTFPAYTETAVQARNIESAFKGEPGDHSPKTPAEPGDHSATEPGNHSEHVERDLSVMVKEWHLAAERIKLDGTPRE